MPAIERDGARIDYDVQGEGPALVLGHSLLFDRRMWDGLVPSLARHFRVINVDARAHGRSTTAGRFTLEDLAADWLAILDREGIERALLCGLSMGGMTALRVALAAPARVEAMALLATSADRETPGHRVLYRLVAELQRAVRIDALSEPLVVRKMFGRTSQKRRPEVVERGMAIIRDQAPRAVYPAVRAVFSRGTLADQLGRIRCPTLVVVGDEDTATPPIRARRIAERVPGARLERVPEAGHISVMDRPDAVERLLLEFLTRPRA